MRVLLTAAFAAVIVASGAHAEVRATTDTGFTIVHKAKLAAPPAKAYAALGEVGGWWDDAHTYSGKASNMSLPLEAGGCFCERLEGGGVQHGRVVLAMPGSMLRLEGALGPLQSEGVSATLTFELKPAGDGTDLTLSYKVGGYHAEGVRQWAAPVDQVLGVQASRLAAYASGKP